MDFNNLIHTIQKSYYTLIILFFVELLALVLAILFVRKDKIGRYFIFYLGFDYVILIINFYVVLDINMSREIKNNFIVVTNTLIGLIELLVYYSFFQKVLISKTARSVFKILQFVYLSLIIIYIVTKYSFLTNRLGYISYILSAIEFLFIIPPCIIFFQQILKQDSPLNLFERPSFWIVTGIFFYSLISVPYYLVKKYLDLTQYDLRSIFSSALFYVPLIINFLFIIKAISCKKNLTI
jgi:hypothetical protein